MAQHIIGYEILSRTNGSEWRDDGIGDPNQFGTEAEAQAAIDSFATLGEDWAAAEYKISPLYGEIDDEEAERDLPAGFDTIDALFVLDAGRAYAANRWPQRDIAGAERIVRAIDIETIWTTREDTTRWIDDNGKQGFDTRVVADIDSPCCIDKFADGSIYVHSNADDEVWADLGDYLSHYELELAEVGGSTVTRAI